MKITTNLRSNNTKVDSISMHKNFILFTYDFFHIYTTAVKNINFTINF